MGAAVVLKKNYCRLRTETDYMRDIRARVATTKSTRFDLFSHTCMTKCVKVRDIQAGGASRIEEAHPPLKRGFLSYFSSRTRMMFHPRLETAFVYEPLGD